MNASLAVCSILWLALVIKLGTEFQVIAKNKLDEQNDASAAIVDNEIFYRGKQHLYCIAK